MVLSFISVLCRDRLQCELWQSGSRLCRKSLSYELWLESSKFFYLILFYVFVCVVAYLYCLYISECEWPASSVCMFFFFDKFFCLYVFFLKIAYVVLSSQLAGTGCCRKFPSLWAHSWFLECLWNATNSRTQIDFFSTLSCQAVF
jgi:hypothetical protein